MTIPALPKSKAQLRVLDEIGCGNYSPIMAKKTKDVLLKAGLIEKLSPKIIGSGAFAVRVEQFQMPTPVHLAWCLSCEGEEEPTTA